MNRSIGFSEFTAMNEMETQVLVVDDVKNNVEYIIEMINTLENTRAHGVYSGEEALEYISANQVDLILLDIGMPVLDGFEVCRYLKSDKETADIPIIFLTAMVQKEHIVKGFELGAVDYVTKPFNLTELLSRVRTHIELRSKTRQLIDVNQKLEEKVAERTRQLLKANKQLSKSNKQLSDALAELSSLDNAKNEFISHINHELRTPLNGIMGYTALLVDELKDQESLTYLNTIDSLVARLNKVSEISLLLTELNTINGKLDLGAVDLLDVVQKSIDRESLERKDLKLEIITPQNKKLVRAEPRLLANCISMVLDNAIKYSPCMGNIEIHFHDKDKYFSVAICDEGPGISDQVQAQLFELFAADNLEHRSHGFGMGLATAKRIMDLQGGKISIKNRDRGTSVELHLKKADSLNG